MICEVGQEEVPLLIYMTTGSAQHTTNVNLTKCVVKERQPEPSSFSSTVGEVQAMPAPLAPEGVLATLEPLH